MMCPHCESEDFTYLGYDEMFHDELFSCKGCFKMYTKSFLSKGEISKSTSESAVNTANRDIPVNTGVEYTMKMFNLIVGDKGKKSVGIGTLWYDEERKAPISGFIDKEALSAALKDGNVTTQPGSDKSRFHAGKPCFRIAAFPVTRGAGAGVNAPAASKGEGL